MVEGSKDGVVIQSLDDTKIRGQIKGFNWKLSFSR